MAAQRSFRIGQTIGEGGFGTVYEATQVTGDGFTRPVAIKVLKDTDEAAQEYAQRLRDEARMLGLIRHRSIVGVHGLMQLHGRWAVAMELIEGADLAQVMSLGPMPPTIALAITAEAAAALHVAYTTAGPGGTPLRLLHRDIKPGNIRLTSEGDVKILDFGAGRAEFTGREAKTEALTFGSRSYMAPERLDGFDSHAADVYSLGVVLFEMLTGSAFGRSSAAPDRHAARLREVMDQLWRATDEVSEDLVRLAGSVLAYTPSERPDARAVERFCSRLSRTLEGPLLRDWSASAIADSLKTAPPHHPGPLTGLEFSDSGLELVAETPDPARRPQDHGDTPSTSVPPAAFGARSTTPPPELSKLFTSSSVIPRGRSAARLKNRSAALPKAPAPVESDRSTGALVVGALTGLLLVGGGVVLKGRIQPSVAVPSVPRAPPSTLSAPTVPLSLDVPGQAAKPPPELPAPVQRQSTPPADTKPSTGWVEITGYAEEVWLVSDSGRAPPGEVSVGRYRVQARFSTEDSLQTVGTVDVKPGVTSQLNCSKVYGRCTTRD